MIKKNEIIVGLSFYNNSGNINAKKCHIVSIASIEKGLLIVTYRYWLKTRQHWVYVTEEMKDFKYQFEIGLFTTQKFKHLNKE